MPRPERPVDPSLGPAQRFAHGLRKLRQEAGNPPYRDMAGVVHFSKATLSAAARGHRLPTWDVTAAYVRACDGDLDLWRSLWLSARDELGLVASEDNVPGNRAESPSEQPGDPSATETIPVIARRRRRLFAAIGILTLVLVGSVSGVWALKRSNMPRVVTESSPATETPARFIGGQEPVADNADPKKSGCAADPAGIATLDKVQINTANENFLGEAELRHSPSCHASWGRFVPSPRLTYLQSNGPIRIRITAHRPATGTLGTPYETVFDGQPAFGNIMLDFEGCIEITVHVEAPDGPGSATTNCLR